MKRLKPRILVAEDSKSVARMYRQLLSGEHDVTMCCSGTEVQSLIRQHRRFDLAIMDIVLPPEDEGLPLVDSQRTGLRLMESMARSGTCPRFYVITVQKDLKEKVEAICRDARAVLQFVYKLDSEPEELVENVRHLLTIRPRGEVSYTLGGLRMVVQETRDYLELCREFNRSADSLGVQQTARLGAAMRWLSKALNNPWFLDFYRDRVLTDPDVGETWAEWLRTLKQIKALLEEKFRPAVHGTLYDEIDGAVIAIEAFATEFRLPDVP